MHNSPTPCQIWGGCCICMQYVPCLPSLCCALQIQSDPWQKLRFKNLIERIVSAQTQHRYGKYTQIRSALSCLCFAWCCRSVQVAGTQLPPLPMQRVLGARGRPGSRSCYLAWTYIVPLSGTDQQGIFIVNTTVLLWSVAKREKQEEDQKSCALLWKFLCSCISSPTGP